MAGNPAGLRRRLRACFPLQPAGRRLSPSTHISDRHEAAVGTAGWSMGPGLEIRESPMLRCVIPTWTPGHLSPQIQCRTAP